MCSFASPTTPFYLLPFPLARSLIITAAVVVVALVVLPAAVIAILPQ